MIIKLRKNSRFVVLKDGMNATDLHTFLTEKQIFLLKYIFFSAVIIYYRYAYIEVSYYDK